MPTPTILSANEEGTTARAPAGRILSECLTDSGANKTPFRQSLSLLPPSAISDSHAPPGTPAAKPEKPWQYFLRRNSGGFLQRKENAGWRRRRRVWSPVSLPSAASRGVWRRVSGAPSRRNLVFRWSLSGLRRWGVERRPGMWTGRLERMWCWVWSSGRTRLGMWVGMSG